MQHGGLNRYKGNVVEMTDDTFTAKYSDGAEETFNLSGTLPDFLIMMPSFVHVVRLFTEPENTTYYFVKIGSDRMNYRENLEAELDLGHYASR